MGTNFYARIIPSKKRKKELKDLIDTNDFKAIREEVLKTYDSFNTYDKDAIPEGEIHLGKRSGGWKFLWNPNIYLIRNGHREVTKHPDGHETSIWIDDPDTAYYVYPLTKDGIKAFIDRDDVEIYDEYGEKQDKEEFWNDALNWVAWRGEEAFDSKSYDEWEKKQNPNYRAYVCSGEYIELLKNEGFKMNHYTNSDFYSDGLRFATCNDFS